jgi:uncharacterized caspase-like protein
MEDRPVLGLVPGLSANLPGGVTAGTEPGQTEGLASQALLRLRLLILSGCQPERS